MKKGQIEIMGLMIVVVLIVIGGLFYVKFVLLQPVEKDESSIFLAQSNNLIGAMLKIDLCNVSIQEGFAYVYYDKDLCGNPSNEYVEKIVKNILDNVLSEDSQYYFIVSKGDEVFFKVGGDCLERISSGTYPFKALDQQFSANLFLCTSNY